MSEELQESNNNSNATLSPPDGGNVVGGVPPEGGNPIKESILLRASILHLVFWVMAIWAVGVVVWLQLGPKAQSYKEQATQYSFRNEILQASRGDILSDDYRTMATSIVYYDLRMDLATTGLTDELFNANVAPLSVALAEFFKDKSAAQYQTELMAARQEHKRYYRLTSKKVDYLELQQLLKFPILNLPPNIGGFIPQEMGRRVNPYGELAGRTIGFVNKNGVKVGLEGNFDDYLKGRDGITVKQKISGNFWIPVSSQLNIEPVNGQDVVTTINIEIQDIVQRALNARLVEAEADWGTIVVMDVKTGHIKAIANGTRGKDGKVVEDYNYAVGMSLEPGSTFKLAGMLALLDDMKVPITKQIDTEGGTAQVGYVKVVDSRNGGYGVQSLAGVFEHSSNIGMAKAVMQYYSSNPARFVEYMSKLGLNKEFGLQIAGEAKPLIKHPALKNGWDGTTLTMMSYGYALRVAPIHTLALYNAIANDGHMIKPQFVTELRDHGKQIRQYPPETIVPSICSPITLANIKSAMVGVVERGTAKMLQNNQYQMAAKTGTAQIAMGRAGYSTGSGAKHYLGSVVGYFPADKPRYTIIVALKTFYTPGSDKPYYGGALAGPLFKQVADQIYNIDFELHKPQATNQGTSTARLSASAGPAEDLNTLVRTLGLPYPKANGMMAAIDSGRVTAYIPKTDSLGVPNVKGVALNLALKTLYDKGYKVRIDGRGRIYDQQTERDPKTDQTTVILKLK